MSTTSKSKTMIEGPLAKQILLVSLPLALSNLLQILFNMSDVAVVGRFAGSTALGSVGSTATFVTLFTGFLIGLSNGVNVLVARFYVPGTPRTSARPSIRRCWSAWPPVCCCCSSACSARLCCWSC